MPYELPSILAHLVSAKLAALCEPLVGLRLVDVRRRMPPDGAQQVVVFEIQRRHDARLLSHEKTQQTMPPGLSRSSSVLVEIESKTDGPVTKFSRLEVTDNSQAANHFPSKTYSKKCIGVEKSGRQIRVTDA